MSKLSTAQIHAADRYSHDGEFKEPLVRCDSCAKLMFSKKLSQQGSCDCGNTRVRNITKLSKKELNKVTKWASQGKLDQVWVNLWVAVE